MLRFPVIQLPVHFVSPKTKRWLIATAGCAAVALFTYLFVSGFPTISAQTAEGQVTVEAKIELVQSGDFNQNAEIVAIDPGDTVRLTFDIVNRTDNEYKFATLQTGLNRSFVYDLWNPLGATSLDDANNTISFPNLFIASQSRQTVSLDVTAQYFTEGERVLSLTPELLDRNGSPIGQVIPHDLSQRPVAPADTAQLPAWVMIPGVSPSPSPSATPEITPEPTQPSPEATAGAAPTVEASPTLEPTVTPTSEPSFTPSAVEGSPL